MNSKEEWTPWRNWGVFGVILRICEFVIWIVVEVIVHHMIYNVGKVLIYMASFGKSRFQQWSVEEHINISNSRCRVVSQTTSIIVGVTFWLLMGTLYLTLCRWHGKQ